MLVVQQIVELIEGQTVEQTVEQRAEIAVEQIVEMIGEQVVELVVEQTAVMAGADSVVRPIVAAEELMAVFVTAVEASCSEQPVAVDATDVDKVDVAAVVLIGAASDCLQEEELKLDLLSY